MPKQRIPTRQATELLGLLSLDGASAFMRRKGLVPVLRGRHLLWEQSEVEALIGTTRKAVKP